MISVIPERLWSKSVTSCCIAGSKTWAISGFIELITALISSLFFVLFKRSVFWSLITVSTISSSLLPFRSSLLTKILLSLRIFVISLWIAKKDLGSFRSISGLSSNSCLKRSCKETIVPWWRARYSSSCAHGTRLPYSCYYAILRLSFINYIIMFQLISLFILTFYLMIMGFWGFGGI